MTAYIPWPTGFRVSIDNTGIDNWFTHTPGHCAFEGTVFNRYSHKTLPTSSTIIASWDLSHIKLKSPIQTNLSLITIMCQIVS